MLHDSTVLDDSIQPTAIHMIVCNLLPSYMSVWNQLPYYMSVWNLSGCLSTGPVSTNQGGAQAKLVCGSWILLRLAAPAAVWNISYASYMYKTHTKKYSCMLQYVFGQSPRKTKKFSMSKIENCSGNWLLCGLHRGVLCVRKNRTQDVA